MFTTMLVAVAVATPAGGTPTAKNVIAAYSRMQVVYPARLTVTATVHAGAVDGGNRTFSVAVDKVPGRNVWVSAGQVDTRGGVNNPTAWKIGTFQVGRSDVLRPDGSLHSQWVFSVPIDRDNPNPLNIGNPIHKNLTGSESPFLMTSENTVGPAGVGQITVRE